LIQALQTIATLAQADVRLRHALIDLGKALAEWEAAAQVPTEHAAPQALPLPDAPQPSPVEPAATEPVPPLPAATLYAPILVPPPPPPKPQPVSDADLPVLAAHFELKADGCDWHVKRRKLIEQGADFHLDVAPQDKTVLDRGRAANCFLWMNRPNAPTPPYPMMDTLAQCYRNAARAIRLVSRLAGAGDDSSAEFTDAIQLLAEALSALRVAIFEVHDFNDPDHFAAFGWLRAKTFSASIFVDRYMRLDDPADPNAWLTLQARIDEIDARLEQRQRSARERAAAINKVKFHVGKLHQQTDGEHWRRIIDAISALVQSGMRPSNVELRELLLPAIDELPDNADTWPAEFRQVLVEIDRYLASRESEPQTITDATAELSADVLSLRPLLAGKAIVLIGGQQRHAARQKLIDAFGLSRLDWLDVPAHSSHYDFEPAIQHDDVALVLLAIRWSSHSYAEVNSFCQHYGKPLVRLPAGYSPNQVAAQIRQQAGKRLGLP
jgi:hypothetical protein